MAIEHLRSFASLVGAGDRDGAIRQAAALREDGWPIGAVIDDLVAPVMVDVGLRWQEGRLSVAGEHAATALVEAVVDAIDDGPVPDAPAGVVALACAEGEWHGLPARLTAARLRARGWDAVVLGAGGGAPHLREFLERADVVALGVSCTVPAFLPGAARLAATAHEAGVPALAGGRGFGPDERRALAVGADEWASGAGAARVLAAWAAAPPDVAAAGPRDQTALEGALAEATRDALAVLAGTRDAEGAIGMLGAFLLAAFVAADPGVVVGFLDWLRTSARGTGRDPLEVHAFADALADALATRHAPAAALLREASRI